MNCFDCAESDWLTPAVAVCHDCGAAVCADAGSASARRKAAARCGARPVRLCSDSIVPVSIVGGVTCRVGSI